MIIMKICYCRVAPSVIRRQNNVYLSGKTKTNDNAAWQVLTQFQTWFIVSGKQIVRPYDNIVIFNPFQM